MEKEEENIKYDYIIYHKNCIDGFTGLFLFMRTKYRIDNPIIYPDVPSSSDIPPKIENKNIICIDVAYKPEIIKEMNKKCNKLLFIDHHISIINDITDMDLDKTKIIYDINKSGASLVWDYFYKDEIPRFVKYIEQNDIGKWDDPHVKDFISALEVKFKFALHKNNLNKMNKLFSDSYVDVLLTKGRTYNEYKKFQLNKSVYNCNFLMFPSKKYMEKYNFDKQYKICLTDYKNPNISEVGNYISKNIDDIDFCLLWSYNVKRQIWNFFLRSYKTDIDDVAKKFGGGGHKLAAGFKLTLKELPIINDLFDNLK